MITIYGEYFDPNADSIEVLVGGKLQTATYTKLHAYLHIMYCMAQNFHGRKFSYKTLNLKKLNFQDKIFMN